MDKLSNGLNSTAIKSIGQFSRAGRLGEQVEVVTARHIFVKRLMG